MHSVLPGHKSINAKIAKTPAQYYRWGPLGFRMLQLMASIAWSSVTFAHVAASTGSACGRIHRPLHRRCVLNKVMQQNSLKSRVSKNTIHDRARKLRQKLGGHVQKAVPKSRL